MPSTTANQPRTARAITPLAIAVEHLQEAIALAAQGNVAPEMEQHLQKALALAAGIDPYVEECTTHPSPALAHIDRRTRTEDWDRLNAEGKTAVPLEQEMLSGHVEGQTLKLFVQMSRAKRILDIGMFTGYSALAMAEGLPDDGIMIACEVDAYVAQFARECFDQSPHGKKIQIEVRPALETLKQLVEQRDSFDFAFIDAAKQEYGEYYRLLLDENLLRPGGVICVDNTFYCGEAFVAEGRRPNGEAIANFNRMVAQDDRVEQVLLPVRDGLTLIRRLA